jgi:hypothetical protein
MKDNTRTGTLEFDYILIIEFLGPGDKRTGSRLKERISKSGLGAFPVKLEVCKTSRDVFQVLRDVTRRAGKKKRMKPLVHIEAHGRQRSGKHPAAIGYETKQRQELVIWEDLWPLLRKLNVATDFNLLVVVAACFGDEVRRGLVHGIEKHHVRTAPFMACVGFVEDVAPASLLDATSSMYERLGAGASLEQAVDVANKQLGEHEQLSCQWTAKILLGVISELDDSRLDDHVKHYMNRLYLDDPDFSKTRQEVRRDMAVLHRLAIEDVMSKYLSYATHPANRVRFGMPDAPEGFDEYLRRR